MADTYALRTLLDDAVPSETTDILVQRPYIEHVAAYSLFNAIGSGKLVKIKDVQITEHGVNNAFANSLIYAQLTSAQSGGCALTPQKHDSTASLSALVEVAANPNVTLAGAALGSQVPLVFTRYDVVGTAPVNSGSGLGVEFFSGRIHMGGSSMSSRNLGRLHRSHMYKTVVQPYVLREGEGFCIHNNLTTQENLRFGVRICFSVGSNSYTVDGMRTINGAQAMIGIFNRSGSGVIVKIDRVEIYDFSGGSNASSERVAIYMEQITGQSYGKTLTPTKHDQNTQALPSGVTLKRNAVVTQVTADSMLSGWLPSFNGNRLYRRYLQNTVGLNTNSGLEQLTLLNGRGLFKAAKSSMSLNAEVALREGQGLGLIYNLGLSNGLPTYYGHGNYGNYGGFSCDLEITMTFTVEEGTVEDRGRTGSKFNRGLN